MLFNNLTKTQREEQDHQHITTLGIKKDSVSALGPAVTVMD